MNCRAIILDRKLAPKILFLMQVFFSSLVSAQKSPVNWSQFQSQIIEIQDDSSGQGQVLSTYPSWMQTIYTHWLSWEPRVKDGTGDGSGEQAPDCRLSFSSSNLKGKLSELSQFTKVKPDCIYLHGAGKTPSTKKILKALSVEFDLSDREHFRKVSIRLPANATGAIHLRGLLGIHDDQKARPLLILRMGVHGNVDEFLAERFIAKAAYEDFGFNFLALENLTSHGYLSQENPVTFGGIEEGLQTFLILQELKRNEYKLSQLISDVHLFGVSLGAHGVFVTQMLDEQNSHYLKTATLFCPVVNLIKTMNFHSQASVSSAFVDLWNHRRLKAVPEKISELNHTEWWKTFFDLKPRFMPAILDYLETHQIQPVEKLPDGIHWPEGLHEHLMNSKSFSALNDFWPFYQNKNTPVLIVTTAKDLLVSEEINTDLILQKKQPGNFAETQIYQLDRGTHCGLPADFQWNYILQLFSTQWGK